MRVLIVRLSSMGDVVQTLPALTDATREFPQIKFDWAVDEAFAQIPAWHQAVGRVFGAGLRRWGKDLRGAMRSGEFNAFRRSLRERQYDAIVDLQGEWKSAFVTRLARGPIFGHNGSSAHERGAHLLYNKRLPVPKGQHSIERMRRLLSLALNYRYTGDADYGVVPSRLPANPLNALAPYVVFVHSTSWESKCWPEQYWIELKRSVMKSGFRVVLPWGNEAERQRSHRIAEDDEFGTVLPPLSIAEKASIITSAAATVGLDTGLSHIAAAFGIPSVTIYGATDPALVGATGKNQLHLASGFECVRCHETICRYEKPTEFKPACFVEIRPENVFQALREVTKVPSQSAPTLT